MGSCGLWSFDKDTGSPLALHITARESPTLAQIISFSTIRQILAVQPEFTLWVASGSNSSYSNFLYSF